VNIPARTKHTLRASALAAAIALGAPSAHAQIPVTDVALNAAFVLYETAFDALATATTGFFGSFWTWTTNVLMPSIQGATQTIAESQIRAAEQMQKSQLALETGREDMRIGDRYTVTDPCSIGAMAGGADPIRSAPPIGAGAGRRSGGGAGGGAPSRPSTPLGKALAIAEGTVPVPPSEVGAAVGASAGCNAFATGSRAADCSAAKLPAAQSNGYPDADVRASTLIDGPAKAGDRTHRMSVDMDVNSPEEMAIKAFRRNLEWAANEPRALTPAELGTDAGRRYLGIRDVYDARMSLAGAGVDRQMAMIASSTDSIPILQDMTKSPIDSKYVQDYLAKFKPNWQSKGVSADELVNIDVNRHYFNVNYIAAVATMDPTEVQREQLRQTALTNVLLQRVAQEQRVNSLMLGGLLAAATRQEVGPSLQAAHAAAIR
jgi:hypothetical protein